MVTWHGKIFGAIGHFWADLRKFAYFNKTIFEVFFVLLYAAEQVFLVFFTLYFKNNRDLLALTISLFIVLFLTTFALQKIVMESRIRVLEKKIQSANYEKNTLELEYKELKSSYEELARFISEHLYTHKTMRKKRGVRE